MRQFNSNCFRDLEKRTSISPFKETQTTLKMDTLTATAVAEIASKATLGQSSYDFQDSGFEELVHTIISTRYIRVKVVNQTCHQLRRTGMQTSTKVGKAFVRGSSVIDPFGHGWIAVEATLGGFNSKICYDVLEFVRVRKHGSIYNRLAQYHPDAKREIESIMGSKHTDVLYFPTHKVKSHFCVMLRNPFARPNEHTVLTVDDDEELDRIQMNQFGHPIETVLSDYSLEVRLDIEDGRTADGELVLSDRPIDMDVFKIGDDDDSVQTQSDEDIF